MKLLIGFILLGLALSSKAAPRIVGGSDAPEGAYPYQVAIKHDDEYICGGSILNKRWILTAAHCFLMSHERYDILVGTTLLNDTKAQVYHARQFATHKDFNLFTVQNDIGMMRVDSDIEFNDKVQPVVLPKENFKPNTYVTATGWGYTDYEELEGGEDIGVDTNNLKYLVVKTISISECKKYPLGIIVTDTNVCTLLKKGQGVCKGDSGGPLVADGNEQIGIVSFGDPCALGVPDMYTNVYKYLDWIKEQMVAFGDNDLLP